jgi:hypothetical protein
VAQGESGFICPCILLKSPTMLLLLQQLMVPGEAECFLRP